MEAEREMRGVVGEGEGQQAHGGTEVNTGACIVCGERAGSVAILRIAPRRFCFRSRCPDRFLPPHTRPFCFAASSLSRISLSRPRKSLSTDKGNRCVPSRLVHSALLLPIARSRPSPSKRRNFHPSTRYPPFVIISFIQIHIISYTNRNEYIFPTDQLIISLRRNDRRIERREQREDPSTTMFKIGEKSLAWRK